MNRFKGLDLIDSLKNYGQRLVTMYKTKITPKKKKVIVLQEGKVIVWKRSYK